MMVIMALVTTFMTTPLLEMVYPPAELERRARSRRPGEIAQPTFTVLMCVAFDRSGPAMVTLGARAGRRATRRTTASTRCKLMRPTDRASFFIIDQEETGMQGLKPLLDTRRANEGRRSAPSRSSRRGRRTTSATWPR